jgi:lipid-A-disaccharide synthase
MDRRDASVLMVAGEASADLHGAKVVSRLRELAPALRVYGVGGDRLAAAGMETVYHARDFAVVGFVEIVRHIPRLKTAMDRLVRLAEERATPLAILIDYPGFNIVLAKRLKRMGVRVLYYVSPQVWAWGEGRVRAIAANVDRMAVVFEFERDFYRERGVDVEFVGHPLLEEPLLTGPGRPAASPGAPPLLGLLPGSRRQEIDRHLPAMLGAARILGRDVPGLSVALGRAPGIDGEVIDRIVAGSGLRVDVVPPERTYDLMLRATALLVSSGTATLEAACAGAPMAVVYRMAPLSYAIARSLVKTRHIGLVNLVAGEEVVPELIQNDVSPGGLAAAVRPFLTDAAVAGRVSRRLLDVRARLGTPGASDRVARMALGMLGGS